MDIPKISIIIPVYNTAPYLSQCLDSIVHQTLDEIEIICVDDASNDDSRNILLNYASRDSRVKVVTFDIRQSALVARKRGVELATGEFIMFMDSDDYLDLSACNDLYLKISNEKVDILHFSSEIINCAGNPEARINANRNMLKPYPHYLQGQEVFEHCFIQKDFGFTLWNKVFSASLCKQAFSVMEDSYMPKAQDMYSFFILAYYADSYLGWNSIPYYFYCFGRGVTGSADISFATFERYCLQHKVIAALISFSKIVQKEQEYMPIIERFRNQWTNECINLWLTKIPTVDFKKATDLLFESWENGIVPILAKKYWYSRDYIAKKIRHYNENTLEKKGIKTIAFYYYHLTIGGVQRVISLLVPLFQKLGYRVLLITDSDPTENDLSIDGAVERITIFNYKLTNRDNYNIRADNWSNIIKNYSVDLVLYNAWTSPLLLWDILLLKTKQIPVIVQTHSVFSYSLISLNRDFAIIPYVLSLCDGIVTLSNTDKTFWNHFNDRVAYIPNPINPELLQVPHSNGANKTILWIGRFSNEKRPWEAIGIAEKVISVVPDAKLYLLGDSTNPATLNKYKENVKKLGLSDRILFMGYQKDVNKYLEQATVLLMTSLYEGYPMVLPEAQAHKVPSVIYAMPYLEMVKPNNGIISVEQNNRDAAAQEIIHLLNDSNYWNSISQQAYKSFLCCTQYNYTSAWSAILGGNWPSSNISPSSKIMMDTILTHYLVGWTKNNQSIKDIKQHSFSNSKSSFFILWIGQKIVGGIRCYQEHGLRYTLRRLKEQIFGVFGR